MRPAGRPKIGTMPSNPLSLFKSPHFSRKTSAGAPGFFGPKSLVWQVNRDRALVLGGLRAILMQLAEPAVAQAVADHSDFRRDPLGRLVRTLRVVDDILFADKAQALASARRVYALHKRVNGRLEDPTATGPHHEYSALDMDLLLWVYATLIDSLRFTHRLLFPARRVDWPQFYCQGKRFANLFGLPASGLPSDLAGFDGYLEAKTAALQVTATGRTIGRAVLRAPHPWFHTGNRILAAGTLPPGLREQYRLTWTRKDQLLFDYGIAGIRLCLRTLPDGLTSHPLARKTEKAQRKNKGAPR